MSVWQNLYKVKSPNNFFFFFFWETKAQITSRILFDELQEYSAILSKTMCSKWAPQGIQLNPFIDRATQPINSPPWYIDMGFYDPSLQFTIWAFWTKICSSQILLMTCVRLLLLHETCPCSSSHFEMDLKIPRHLPRDMCWRLIFSLCGLGPTVFSLTYKKNFLGGKMLKPIKTIWAYWA